MKLENVKRRMAEWLTIFVSIMAAFTLDRCNDNRREQHQARLYVEALVKDLQADSLHFESNVKECDDRLSTLYRVLTLRQSANPPSDSILTYSLNSFASVSQFIPQSTTYESLKSAGGLGLISDFELQSKIVALYRDYEQIRIVDRVQLDFAQDQVLPYLNSSFDLSIPRPVSKTFYRETVFANMVLMNISGVNEQRKIYVKTLDECNGLKNRLSQTLNP